MIAIKFLDENSAVMNVDLAHWIGTTRKSFNVAELEFLSLFDFNTYVGKREYDEYLVSLKKLDE